MKPLFFFLFGNLKISPATGKKIALLILFQLGGTGLIYVILNYLAFGHL